MSSSKMIVFLEDTTYVFTFLCLLVTMILIIMTLKLIIRYDNETVKSFESVTVKLGTNVD